MGIGSSMLLAGIILFVVGFAIRSGIIQVMLDLTSMVIVVGGIALVAIGGVAIFFGNSIAKVMAPGLIALGILVAVMGLVISFVRQLWIVGWLIDFGGLAIIVLGIMLAVVGVIGMLKSVSKGHTG